MVNVGGRHIAGSLHQSLCACDIGHRPEVTADRQPGHARTLNADDASQTSRCSGRVARLKTAAARVTQAAAIVPILPPPAAFSDRRPLKMRALPAAAARLSSGGGRRGKCSGRHGRTGRRGQPAAGDRADPAAAPVLR